MASALSLLAIGALAASPSVELFASGASAGHPAALLVRLAPGGPVLRPVRANGRCRTEAHTLAQVLQGAFRVRRSLDRFQVRIDPARLEPALEPALCRDPNGWVARALDRASSGRLQAAARSDPPTSRLEVRLERLRGRPLAYAWAEVRATGDDRAEVPAWSAARTDPMRVLGWAARAELVLRSWSERTADPETTRAWAWPWITLTLLGGLPIAALAWARPRTVGVALAAALAGAGIASWLDHREPPPGALAALPLAGALIPNLRRGRGRRLALAALLPLSALALEGDGPALFLVPIAVAWGATSDPGRRNPRMNGGVREGRAADEGESHGGASLRR